jgi:hypothetical protein
MPSSTRIEDSTITANVKHYIACITLFYGIYLSHKSMPISVRIPTEKMTTIAINWNAARCSCPSWTASKEESALRSSLANISDCGSALHASLRHWTWLVIIGVALEVAFVIWEYCEGLHDFNRGIVHAPERPNTLLFVLGLLGAALVASGVTGEVLTEAQIETVETCIRQGNDSLSLLLSQKAEGEHSARVKLESKVAWRRLTKEQRSVITDHLKQFPDMSVGVSYLGGNPEASQFANDIATALHAAQWDIHPIAPFSLFGGFGGGVYPLHPSTGVNVSTTGEKGRDATGELQHDLCSMGFDSAITPKPPVTKGDGTAPNIDMVVLVVARPIAPQGATKLAIDAKTKACIASE